MFDSIKVAKNGPDSKMASFFNRNKVLRNNSYAVLTSPYELHFNTDYTDNTDYLDLQFIKICVICVKRQTQLQPSKFPDY